MRVIMLTRGRVLGVTGVGDDFTQARARAYAAVKNLSFDHMHYRSDIGHRAGNAE